MDARLLVLAFGMFAMGTDNFVVAGILPSVARSLGTTPGEAGHMVSVYALTYAVLAPVMATLAGNVSRKPLLIVALAIFVVGNAISALAPDLETVLWSRALAGLGAALFSPTALGVAAAIVPVHKRGRALATVTAGLAGATALGAPIGTFIGGVADWRSTLWFVAILGALAMIGVMLMLGATPQPSSVSLRERVAPVRDIRISFTLLASVFAFGGFLMVYTYVGLVLDRATVGDGRVLAVLLLVWGVAATLGNLWAGRLVDRFGSRRVIQAMLAIGAMSFCLLPWASAHTSTASMVLVVWGICGWGALVPQQHRLIAIAPQGAPIVLALNNTATYGGLAASSFIGGILLRHIDPHGLSLIGAALILLALVCAEGSYRYAGRPFPASTRKGLRTKNPPATAV